MDEELLLKLKAIASMPQLEDREHTVRTYTDDLGDAYWAGVSDGEIALARDILNAMRVEFKYPT
mgnify:FL=1